MKEMLTGRLETIVPLLELLKNNLHILKSLLY
jgi:hypothetical protein